MSKNPLLMHHYIVADTPEISLHYENKLIMNNMIPLVLFLALVNSVLFPIFRVPPQVVLNNTLHLLGIAVLLWLVSRYVKNLKWETFFIILFVAMFQVFVVIQYYHLIHDIVWVISVAYIIISTARNDMVLTYAVTIAPVILSVYVHFRYENEVGLLKLVTLILVYIGIFVVVKVLKRINHKRVDFIREQLAFSKTISQISTSMVDLDIANFDRKIDDFLKIYGQHFGFDGVGIFLLSSDHTRLKMRYEWISSDESGISGSINKEIMIKNDAWWMSQIENKQINAVLDVNDEMVTDSLRHWMIFNGIRSIFIAPIIMNEDVLGFFVNASFSDYSDQYQDQLEQMKVCVNILTDAFKNYEKEKKINRMAFYDILTGLPNRALFNDVVDNAVDRSVLDSERFAILFIDIDSFKAVNDTMGHNGGDELLRQVADNLNGILGPHDFAARFGGDEFIVLIKHIDSYEDSEERVAKIMATFQHPIMIDQQEFFTSASGGVAFYPDDGNERETLIKNADLAMYSAKDAGKNQYCFCTSEMKLETEKRVRLTHMLYKALDHNEFVLYYQPQIDLQTKKIIGLEALIRWNNPEFGMVMPGVFIALAEQSGAIHHIGQWVLQTACIQNKKWQTMGLTPIRMSVNLSAEQFRNPDLAEEILEVLESTGLDPKYLELEITESIAIRQSEIVIPLLNELKESGITISIDDFGTEYSSLARIKHMPIDRIKMAMEFVHGINVSDKDEALAMVIITLGNQLGLKVVAEGVETENQLDFLEKRICDEVQGFYFYEPMPAEDIERLLLSMESGSDSVAM